MLPYFAVAALVVTLVASGAYVGRRLHGDAGLRKWTPFDVLTVLTLIGFSGMRFGVGTDFDLYRAIFRRLEPAYLSQHLSNSPQEPGFTLMQIAVKSVTDEPQALFWVAATLTVVPAYAAIKRSSINPTLAVALYVLLAFYVAPFNIMRQGIAISLNFWASTYLDRNKKAFVIVNAIAASFHLSALIAAAVQLLVHRKRPTRRLIVGIVAAGVLIVLALDRLPLLGELAAAINPRYDTYLVEQQAAGLGTYLVIVSRLALVGYCIWALRRINGPEAPAVQQFTMFAATGIAMLIVGTQVIEVARLEYYFGIALVVALPNAITARGASFTMQAVIFSAATAYFVAFLLNYGGLLPYSTHLA